MTRETRIMVQHRAAARRSGQLVPIDRAEAMAFADQYYGGHTAAEIAEAHGLKMAQVHRRLFSMGCYHATPTRRQARG